MKRIVPAFMISILLASAQAVFTATPRFEKVTDHFYWLQLKPDGPAFSAAITQGGVLLVNPPAQPELSEVLEALKRVTVKPVNWVINTDYLYERSGGGAELVKQGAVIFSTLALRRLADPVAKSNAPAASVDSGKKNDSTGDKYPDASERLVFGRQMRLYPDNLEIRIFAIQSKAHTAGDIAIHIPAEKVLIVGDLFTGGTYPEIDCDAGGSALGWFDGMKQVVESVPLLKSAMPQPKPNPTKPPPEEKTLEELIVVVPGRGLRSNLQEMKNLLETAQKLRNDVSRAIASGRSRESFISSPAVSPYRAFANFEPFVAQLFDEIAAQKAK